MNKKLIFLIALFLALPAIAREPSGLSAPSGGIASGDFVVGYDASDTTNSAAARTKFSVDDLRTYAATGSHAFTTTGDGTFGGLLVTGDTSAGDSAALGYTATEGLILTGQGSTNDITIKNDADQVVMQVPTGGTAVDFPGSVTFADLNSARLDFSEQASVTNPPATEGTIYLDSDDNTFKGIVADEGNTLQTIVTDVSTNTLTNKTIKNSDNTMQIYTEKHATSHTIDATECYGGVHYVTSAATITLPAAADGMSVTIITVGAIAVSVDPNASDLLMLDGTALDDGDKATNTSTSGDLITLTYYDATGWYAATNGWTDGGP